MNTVWILIIILSGNSFGMGSSPKTHALAVEFSSEETCAIARKDVSKLDGINAECYKK